MNNQQCQHQYFHQCVASSAALLTQTKSTVILIFVIAFLLCAAVLRTVAATGDLDAAFGTGGKVLTPIGNARDLAQAVALQTDGKIVVAGYAQNDFAVTRYNADGSLDASFGSGGKLLTPVGAGNDEAYAVAIQPDRKIVVAGYTGNNFAVVRYEANGALDSSFGTGGKVTTPISGFSLAEAIAVQPDGKIVVIGWSGSTAQFAVVRYNADGSLDTGFGTGGKVTVVMTASSSESRARSVAIQADGKIVVAGVATVSVGQSGYFRMAMLRLTASGALDASFGSGGKVITAVTETTSASLSDVVIQPDGKIVASGDNSTSGPNGTTDTVVVRYNPNGSLDSSFGSGGIVTTRVGTIASGGEAVNLQTNGKIVVATGSYSGTSAGRNDFGALRLNADGSLDGSFGTDGKVITPVGTRDDQVRDAVIQPDGKIVLAGYSEIAADGFNEDFALVRYLGDPVVARRSTPFDFDGDAKADYAVFRPTNGAWYLLNSQSGFSAAQFGISSDKLTPADFDGDGKTDLAVYRSGTWYLQRSSAGFFGIQFGVSSDIPVPADFDGDGKAEIAVFRPSNGTWYFYNLATNQTSGAVFGQAGDKPVPADFDADGKADLAVYRPNGGTWYIQRSSAGFAGIQFGISTDKPIAADYDGDGKADIAVVRQSNGASVWYILGSQQGFYGLQFGIESDKPTPADYDGDGKVDIAVWRPENGVFYVQQSSSQFTGVQFGQNGDAPVAASFVQ